MLSPAATSRSCIAHKLMHAAPSVALQNGQPSRDPRVVRFVYEDRPEWWPAELTYTKQAIDTMQWDVLKPLHARVIQVGICRGSTGRARYGEAQWDVLMAQGGGPGLLFSGRRRCCRASAGRKG